MTQDFYLLFTQAISPTSLPPEAWWVALPVLLILGAAALMDAMSGKVPDHYTLTGILLLTAMHGIYTGWDAASLQFALALGIIMLLWLINQGLVKIWKRDAFGMGDAKWSALAALAFGWEAVVIAWVIGSWLALLWMMIRRIKVSPVATGSISKSAPAMAGVVSGNYVHFAPFLLLGLLGGLFIMNAIVLI